MRAALRVVAADPEGEDALQAFTSSMSAHPVLRVLRQLDAEGVPLSRHAQRLVELLASTRPDVVDEETPFAPGSRQLFAPSCSRCSARRTSTGTTRRTT